MDLKYNQYSLVQSEKDRERKRERGSERERKIERDNLCRPDFYCGLFRV